MGTAKQLPKHTIRIKHGGQEKTYRLEGDEFIIGRDPSLTLCVPSISVSRKHLTIKIDAGVVKIRDVGSSNGTFLGGKRLKAMEWVTLSTLGEEFFLGNVISVSVIPAPRQEFEELVSAQPSPTPPVTTPEPEDDLEAEPESGLHSDIPESNEYPEFNQEFKPLPNLTPEAPSISIVQEKPLAEIQNRKTQFDAEIQAEIKAKQEEAAKFCETLREESRKEARQIIDQAEKSRRESESLKARLEQEVVQRTERLQGLAQEYLDLEKKTNHLKTQVQTLESLQTDLLKELGEIDARRDDTSKHTAAETQRLSALVKEADEQESLNRKLAEEIKEQQNVITELRTTSESFREAMKRDREALEFEARKNKAQFEIMEAEIKAKRISMEISLAEMEAKRNSTVREIEEDQKRLQRANDELAKCKLDTENELKNAKAIIEKADSDKKLIDQLRIEVTDHQIALKTLAYDKERAHETAQASLREREKIVAETTEIRTKFESLETRKQELSKAIAFSTDHLKAIESDGKKAQERLERDRLEGERSQAKINELKRQIVKLEEDFATAKSEAEKMELTATEGKQRVETELAALRRNEEKALATELAARKEAAQNDYLDKVRALEREFAEARQVEIEKLSQIKTKAELEESSRRQFILDEIVECATALAQQGTFDQMIPQFRNAVKNALEGKSTGNLSAKAAARTKKFWKKMGTIAAVPAGIAILSALFPQAPSLVKRQFQRTVASENKEAGGVFLEEIRNRGLKFQPPTDRNYRDSYSDNILYLDKYPEMKLDAETQKEWTLLLNDFIVGRLGLSDRIIPDFIGSEAVLVKDIIEIREGLVPQFKDQGIARMNEAEKKDVAKLQALLQTEENYKKFRLFEKSFYSNYADRKPASK